MRIIMLVDMDYFYVACEELRRPEIKGKPAVVGADPKKGSGRGVVMTCNYPARKFGIRSGMPISTAYRIKPDAIFIQFDFDYYDEVSAKVMKVIESHADKFEQVSVDEAFIDVSKKAGDYAKAKTLAEKIKEEIRESIGLQCSIGISYNKLLAKMVCETVKPNGIGIVTEQEAKEFLEDKDLLELYGVGGKTKDKLVAAGYNTIGDLSRANVMDLHTMLGAYGVEIHNNANGRDDSKVEENRDARSISREATFEEDTSDENEVLKKIRVLAEGVSHDVDAKKLSFKVVTLKIRYDDFTENLKSMSIRRTNKLDDMVRASYSLFHNSFLRGKKVRKLGVRVSDLIHFKGQKTLGEFGKAH